MRFILPIVLLFSVLDADAQVKKFRWNTEFCEFEGTYNIRKYTETQLRNTLKLLSPSELRVNSVDATVWKYDDIGKLDTSALQRQFENVTTELKSLDFVKTRYTAAIRAAKLREAKQVYELSRTTMLAYAKPAVIREYPDAAGCRAVYGEPLIAGGDRLLETWLKVNQDSRKKNADPERLRRIFDEQYSSPDKFKFALVEVMSFGWWNCANEHIEYYDIGQGDEPVKEFKKLFTRVRKIRCDEP